MTKVKPYEAILPTILCQQPAVILHRLNEQRASGNLPVEIVLDVLIELVSRQASPIESKSSRELINAHNAMYEQLEVYKRAVIALRQLNEIQDLRIEDYKEGCDCITCGARLALHAVDKLEGK